MSLLDGKIFRDILEVHAELPKRTVQMVKEVDDLFGDTLNQMVGSFYLSLERKRDKAFNDDVSIADLAMSLRRDKAFKKNMDHIIHYLQKRSVSKVQSMQRRAYREGLKALGKVMNENTEKGIGFEITVGKREMRDIFDEPISGQTIKEWIEEMFHILRRKILSMSSMYYAKETGIESGRLLLAKKMRNALEKAKRDLKDLATLAVNVANAKAYESVNEMFAEENLRYV